MSNRYTRVSPSEFSPLSMNQIFSVPLAKQQQHDALLQQGDELGLFDVQALDKDKELRDNYIGEYQGKIDNVTQDIMANGINNMSKQALRKLSTERNQWLTKGDGASISSNYGAFVENKEQLNKLYESGKISKEKYELGLQDALSNYEGVANKGKYAGFTAEHDVDYQKKATDIAKAIKDNPKKITQFSGLQYDPKTGKYLDIKTNREFTEKGAIRAAVRAGLMMDQEVMSDLTQRQKLGMFGDTPVEQVIDGLGIFNEIIYSKDNRNISKQYTGIDQGQLDMNTGPSARSYEYGFNKQISMNRENLQSSLSKIMEGKSFQFSGTPTPYKKDENGELVRNKYGEPVEDEEINDRYGKKANYENLTTQEKNEYDSIYNGLVKTGALPQGASKDDPSTVGAISNYLEAAENFSYQEVKYTDGLIKTYEGRNKKWDQKTPEKLAQAISLNPELRYFYDIEEGKEVKFEDLDSEIREEILAGKARISGVYSPRNMFTKSEGKLIRPEILTSPLELQVGDNKKYLVSRGQSEMNTPAYKADMKMNEIWSDITVGVNLPHEHRVPGIGKLETTKTFDGKIKVNANGEQAILDNDDALEHMINTLYGINGN